VKAGKATITATVTHADGTVTPYSKTIYTTLANGVYYFHNVETNARLEFFNNSCINENDQLEAWYWGSGQNEPGANQRYAMFKIKHLGEGEYSIRSMLRSDMGFKRATGTSNLISVTIGTDDSSLTDRYKWQIGSNHNGYYIHSVERSDKTITAPASTSEHDDTLTPYDETNTLQNWTLLPVTTAYHGVVIYDTVDYLVVGDSYPFAASIYSSYPNENGQRGFSWSVSLGSESATIDSDGKLTGEFAGPTTVTATYSRDASHIWNSSHAVTVLMREGLYYLKNTETARYLQPSNDDGGSHMKQQSYDRENTKQRWQFIYESEDYFYIKNVNTGLYLTAPDGVTANIAVLQEEKSESKKNQQIWEITRVAASQYTIRAQIHQNSNLVLAVGAGLNVNGIHVEQRAYTEDNDCRDLWCFENITYSLVNYYDSTFADPVLIAHIAIANSFVNTVYLKKFNVKFIMDGAASRYANAIADQCLLGNNAACTDDDCGSKCSESHHKNLYEISRQLHDDSREDNHIYIMWSNRLLNAYCYEEELTDGIYQHIINDALANVWNHWPVVHFMGFGDSRWALPECSMALILAHEIAHTMGMDEVYDNPGHDQHNAYVCIMEHYEEEYANKYYEKILSGDKEPFCESCKETLCELVMRQIISGN